MFDITRITRPSILAQHEYTPNKPPDAVMRDLGFNDYVDLATNENPHGISPRAYAAILKEAKDRLHHYPESTCHDVLQKLAEVHCLSPENFIVDNGLDAVISLLGMTFLDPLDEIIIPDPTFHAYENTAARMGAAVVRTALTVDYRPDIDKIIAAVTDKTKVIFICNPNNPTGTIITEIEFKRLLGAVPPGVLLVVDEAFYEFVDDPAYPQTIPYLQEYANLVVLRSFSKTMALAGLRIGYAVASPEIIRMLLRAREPFPVNRLAQVAAAAALEDHEFIQRTLEINRISRKKMAAAFEELGVKAVPSQTNFVFIDLGRPVAPVWEAMFKQGVIVRKLENSGAPTCMRICLGKQRDLQRALNALASALGKKAPLAFTEYIDE